MPSIDLSPLAKTDEALRSWLDVNFKRIADSLELIPEFAFGVETITGGVELGTSLINCQMVIASFVDFPVAGAAFLRAVPVNTIENRGTDYGNIYIEVLTSGFASSSTPIQVGWLAIGSTKI